MVNYNPVTKTTFIYILTIRYWLVEMMRKVQR